MKITYLLIGVVIGVLIGFGVTKYGFSTCSETKKEEVVKVGTTSTDTLPEWKWSDTLDAVKVAPESHKVVYEDADVRILQVLLDSEITEPVHTHQWKSIMWFAQATPMTYYIYDGEAGKLAKVDSIPIAQMPMEALNQGGAMEPEGPHAIKNLSKEKGIAYRIEFKKEFKP